MFVEGGGWWRVRPQGGTDHVSEDKGKVSYTMNIWRRYRPALGGKEGPREEWTVTRASTDLHGRLKRRTWDPRAYSKAVGSSQGLHQLLEVPKEWILPVASVGRYRELLSGHRSWSLF